MDNDTQPAPDRRRQSDATATALISSSPDVNAIFQGLVERFLGLPGRIGAFFSWWLSNIWIIAAIGVPAMLAAAPLMDKIYEGRAAERQYQLEMFKVQSNVEIEKMDRTLLGEGAMSTLKAIAAKLDQQSEQTLKIQMDVTKLAGDVEDIQKAQAKADRKVGTLQAQIRRIPAPETPE